MNKNTTTTKAERKPELRRKFDLIVNGEAIAVIKAKDHHCAARQARAKCWPKGESHFSFRISPQTNQKESAPPETFAAFADKIDMPWAEHEPAAPQPAKAAQICDECSRRLEDGALFEDHSLSGTVKQGRRPMFKSFKQEAKETAAELERVKALNSELARWVKGHMDSAGFTARRKADELIAKSEGRAQ